MVNYKQIQVSQIYNCKINTRKAVSFLGALLLFFVFLFSATQSYAQLAALPKVPSTAAPGSSFIVKISINRGPINGFMKLSQALPEGYTAVELDSKSGDFRYENNETKIIWLKAPIEATYTVTYKVKVPKNASGTIPLAGKITYVTNSNERKVFDLPLKKVTITNAPEKDGSKPTKSDLAANVENNTTNKKTNKKTNEIKPESSKVDSGTNTATSKTNAPKTHSVAQVKKKYGFRKGGLELDSPDETNDNNRSSDSGKKFKVQIGAFRQTKKIKNVPQHTTILVGDITKHFSGNFSTYEEASERKSQMIEQGFKDAFIVTFPGENSDEIPKAHICKSWWHCLKANVFN